MATPVQWRRAVLLLAACAVLPSPAATLPVTDAAGRSVVLSAPAERIVALAPHIVENLYSIGAGSRIVGAVDYSDFPAPARKLPRVGGIAGISLERIAALEPDLVIGWLSGTDGRVTAALASLDIPYYLDEIRSLEALGRSLEHLGALTGEGMTATAARRSLERTMASQGLHTNAPRPTVFLQLWDRPLQSVGAQHLLTDVMAHCGGRSITADVPGLAPRIELESVLAADPELIIVESDKQALHWQRFPALEALRNGRIHVVDPDLMHRPTLRLLDGMRAICAAIDEVRSGAPSPDSVYPDA